jgi:transcription antitermination protein NusB
MLNRRFLRIKVMQALYAYFQHENADPAAFERDLFKSLDKIYDLYLTILALLGDIHHTALMVMDENKNKRLPGKDDLNPNIKFIQNRLLESIANDKNLNDLLQKRKISWQGDFDIVRKLFTEIRNGDAYKQYMLSGNSDFDRDREFVLQVITTHLTESELLISHFEEKNMHWADDTFVAFNSVIRTIEESDGKFTIQPLLRDEKDDLAFMSVLFNKTILYRTQLDELISKHTKNWEIERIANMDVLLMEMALAEVLYLPNIPVKASLNEYIDISKEYSSPNSRHFVNGVLDKIIAELKRDGKVSKTGRGLKED